jgi:hypothetical protein
MSPTTTSARPSEAAGSKHAGSAAGSWFSHALDKLHITHHAEAVDVDKLGEEVLERVRAELTAAGAWGDAEAAFCDGPCLRRYLRARSMDVT